MIGRVWLVLFSIFSVGICFGGIEQFFKKPTETLGNHGMRNIDFIYIINLDKRPEKLESCTRQLHPYGIFPYRFSAVNGWELSLDTINQLGVIYTPSMKQHQRALYYSLNAKGQIQFTREMMRTFGRNYFCSGLGRGAIGIVLSHLSILQHAFDSGFSTIWVMEDDIEIKKNPHLLSELIDRLDTQVGRDKWDILFTDQDTKGQDGQYVSCYSYAERPDMTPSHPERFAQRENVSVDFRKIGARYGAYSMIIRRSGMKKILDFFKTHKIFSAYDADFFLPENISLYTVRDDVVSTQPQAPSDNGKPNYLKKAYAP